MIQMGGCTDVSCLRPMVHVLCVILIMTMPIMQGVFDTVHTDLTLDHYAEKPWPLLKEWIPWCPLPVNTVVNVAYMCTGLYWLLATKILVKEQTRCGKKASTNVTGHDVYMMYAFCWMAIIYGPVQMTRLLLLRHRLAVLDQWYTLPGFAWTLVWALYFLRGWSRLTMLGVIIVSSLSYCLTLFHKLGFEVALGCHIIIVVKYCWDVQNQFGTSSSRSSFIKAILNCVGFVILKLVDNYLPLCHSIFTLLSGHFWSKICDALQIYFVAEFFFIITLEKARTKRR